MEYIRLKVGLLPGAAQLQVDPYPAVFDPAAANAPGPTSLAADVCPGRREEPAVAAGAPPIPPESANGRRWRRRWRCVTWCERKCESSALGPLAAVGHRRPGLDTSGRCCSSCREGSLPLDPRRILLRPLSLPPPVAVPRTACCSAVGRTSFRGRRRRRREGGRELSFSEDPSGAPGASGWPGEPCGRGEEEEGVTGTTPLDPG